MAQPATNAKIEELRFRVKTDPKSRLFYPLAEELRKAGQPVEAEQVLRSGLVAHPTYLSAWVSLGRVLREQKNDAGAVDALNKALTLDPGNVVAARLLADAYLSLGDKLEAIKKYKLVHALLPADEQLNATIEQLDRELNPPAPAPPAPEPEPEPEPEEAPFASEPEPLAAMGDETFVPTEEAPIPTMESPFGDALAFAEEEARRDEATGDVEPMRVAHEESPFEEPMADYSAAALTVEAPVGFQVITAPSPAEVPAPFEPEEADVFAPTTVAVPSPVGDVANTITMADLYASQGLTDDARQIYENILARDPGNESVREKLDALDGLKPAPPFDEDGRARKIRKLEGWLSRVARKEVNGV